eukprot:COSAG02_NODE_6028_length_3861_cov_32.841839_5_plen_68_part_00
MRELVGSPRVEPAFACAGTSCILIHTLLVWVGLQYLMGAAFHCGADSDLGPIVYDHAGGHGDAHTRL